MSYSGQPEVHERNAVSRQGVPVDLNEAMTAGGSQAVLVGGEHDGLDHPRAELARPGQAAQVDLLAEAVPAMLGKDPGDDRGRGRVASRRPDGSGSAARRQRR
jgi:hypothetical protein